MERLQCSRRGALRLVGTALVGGFAGCGGSNSTTHSAPEANFDWEYTPDGENDYGVVMITHSGTKKLLDPDGDAIDPESLFIRGDGLTDAPSMDYDTSEVGAWSPKGEATGEGETGYMSSPGPLVTKDDSITVAVASDYHLNVVWAPTTGIAIRLSEDTGPAL